MTLTSPGPDPAAARSIPGLDLHLFNEGTHRRLHEQLVPARPDAVYLPNAAEAGRLIHDTPATVWLNYSIHGDETSGADASLAVAYHFAAGTSANVTQILDNVVELAHDGYAPKTINNFDLRNLRDAPLD